MAGDTTLMELLGAADNFHEPTPAWNRASTIIGVTVSLMGLKVICILFRFHVRIFVMRSLGWDDLFLFLYLVFGLLGGICLCLAPSAGLGKHFLTLKLGEQESYFKSFYLIWASYVSSTALIKISLLFQYLRVFETRKLRILCIVLLVTTALWGMAFSFLAWVPCIPLTSYFSFNSSANCYGFGSMRVNEFYHTYVAQGTTNTVLDALILAIPIPYYIKSNAPRRTKIGCAALFAIGAFVTSISVARLVTVTEHRATTSPTFDPTWYSPSSMMLGLIECIAAAICASIPVFWPVLTAQIDAIFVTHEIKITRDHRYSDEGYNEIELQHGSEHSRAGSETSLNHIPSKQGREKTSHYLDDFIQDQVDPLRAKTAFAVESEVKADGPKGKKSMSLFHKS
ncbi:hypothetical protein F4778DRAFT_698996 [Xylariomycetidae sp. FL2044]|nr:hypothetical protein F4778DRAFT_698996 [Xylariomycetidae sp. FL2044]